MEVVNKGNKQNKLTVNPNDGRVTLKLKPEVFDNPVLVAKFKIFAGNVAERIKGEFTQTMRGKIKYHQGTFTAEMSDNAKSNSKKYIETF